MQNFVWLTLYWGIAGFTLFAIRVAAKKVVTPAVELPTCLLIGGFLIPAAVIASLFFVPIEEKKGSDDDVKRN